MTDETISYDKTDDAAYEPIELLEPDGRVLVTQIGQVPAKVLDRLKEAHFQGTLKESYDHWRGVLAGAGIVDRATLNSLKALQSEITSYYQRDQAVIEKISKVLGPLRAQKLR